MRLENFRAVEHAVIEFGNRLTLLIGANGSGKTTILDGIAIALGAALTYLPTLSGRSFKKGDLHQRHNSIAPYTRIALETTTGLKWDRIQRRDKSKSTSKLVPAADGIRALEQFLDATILEPMNQGSDYLLPLFIYYGVSRALLDVPASRKGFTKKQHRFDALVHCLHADSRFRSAFMWFYNKELEENRLQKEKKSFEVTLRELDVVRSAITAMFPDISEPHIALNPLRFVVRQQGELMDIAQLSDGYKTLLGVVIDLSSRLAMANPHLDDPLAAEAIVMIDEVDLHLHPSWQQHVVGDLLRTFKNTQFIITTHSPFIVEAINNHIKRQQIEGLPINNNEVNQLLPLRSSDVKAYLMSDTIEMLMNNDVALLDDKLLEYFNSQNQLYDKMRDLEWEHKG